MRLIRLCALVGSVVLLVATTVSLINKRSELRQEQDARVAAAAQLAEVASWSTVFRALSLTEAANESTDPERLVASFAGGASACVVAADARCTAADLVAVRGFEDAAARSVERGAAALHVDGTDGSLLVVMRADTTAVIRLPQDALLGERAKDALAGYEAEVVVSVSSVPVAGLERDGPEVIDGDVVIRDRIPLPTDDGSIEVRAAIDDDRGLAGDSLPMYATLLALGTVLMGLAVWTFLLDRRTLEQRATTDELTGLVNRREFEHRTEEELLAADRFNTGVCVMLIDLNGFKQINDTRGHQVGDRVLQTAASRLKSAVRETDLVARWGGDEFVILLPGIEDGTGVRASAERIGRSLADTPIVDDITVTAAIGAALFPRHGANLDELIRSADLAMYAAKSTGVTYRLADRHDLDADDDTVTSATGYVGPDRRRTVATERDHGLDDDHHHDRDVAEPDATGQR